VLVTHVDDADRSTRPTIDWPRRVLAELLAAVRFLTRVPLGTGRASNVERTGASAFGLVGAAVGAVGAIVLVVLGGRAPLAASGLAVGAMAVVSGALHLDGLADTADALAAPGEAASTRARKDPAVGPAGAASVALVIIIDVGLLATLTENGTTGQLVRGPIVAALACIVAAAGSRALPVLAIVLAPRDGKLRGLPAGAGLGGWFAANTGWRSALLATGSAVAVALAAAVASGRQSFLLGALCGIVIGLLLGGWLAIRRQGLDGDALGAIVEVGFAAILVGIVVAP
jgi:adenosylcobinamide-GDP ribazoletransferase